MIISMCELGDLSAADYNDGIKLLFHKCVSSTTWNIFPPLLSLSGPPNTHIYTQNFTVNSCILFITLKYFDYVRFLGVLPCCCAQLVLWVFQAELQKCLGCLCVLTDARHVKGWWRREEVENQKPFKSCVICNHRKVKILHVGNLILVK